MIKKREIYQAKVLKLLSEYLTISNIAKILNKDDKTIYQLFLNYRKKGWINKDRSLTSAGLQITEKAFTIIKNKENPENLKPNSARLNNLVFSVIIPKIRNWKNREKYLTLKNINFQNIDLGTWKAQQIVIDNVKVWLTSSRIRLYMPDYYAKTPFEAYSNALDDLYKIVLKLENKLCLKIINKGGIDFDLPKRDISLIKNEVAKKYNKEKRKLYVYDDFNRLRLIIDASKSKITGVNLNEFESVNPELSLEDSTKTQNYFLNVIDKPHYLPSETKEIIDQLAKQNLILSQSVEKWHKEIELHLGVETRTEQNLGKMNLILDKLNETLNKKNNIQGKRVTIKDLLQSLAKK